MTTNRTNNFLDYWESYPGISSNRKCDFRYL